MMMMTQHSQGVSTEGLATQQLPERQYPRVQGLSSHQQLPPCTYRSSLPPVLIWWSAGWTAGCLPPWPCPLPRTQWLCPQRWM